MNIRTESWMGHEIRFVENNVGAWLAVAADICKALGLKQVSRALSGLKDGVTSSKVIDSIGREQEVNVLDEKAIYKLVFKSKKKEAESFQDWVFDVVKTLRQSSGLEGYQIFRMMDKEHQLEMMKKLSRSLETPGKPDFIKANTIANKAVSSKFGHPKMLKKEQMTPQMIVERQNILDDTVTLMAVVDQFGLEISVSEKIYSKYTH